MKQEKRQQEQKSGLAMAGFVISIIGLVLSPIPILNNLAFVLAIISLIFGIVTLKKDSKGKIAIILSVTAIIVVLLTQNFYGNAVEKVGDELNNTAAEIDQSVKRSSGEMTDELLKSDVDVQIGQFSVKESDYMTETVLPVVVKNKNAERKSYSITIEAVDGSGARIEEDTISVDQLGSGQTENIKAFEYVSSDKVEALKGAEFKIIKVSQY